GSFLARFDKNTGWPQPTTTKESHAAEVSPPENRHGLGVLVKYRHPAMKSMHYEVGLRERIHPTRSFHPTLCPFLAIGTGNPWGEVLDREFWHLREVHPSDETRNHHLGLSPLDLIARR